MRNRLSFGTALSAIALASALGGCATPQAGPRSASIFGDKFDKSNVALATRAALALAAEDFAKAVNLAERAVENSPRDAGFRALLGNAYFGGGRFASAEAAYRDSLSLVSNQPQIVLRLALAQIAQGNNGEAIAFLEAARPVLEAADHGLALALAGEPARAAEALEAAARQPGADSRLRQNLALAHALAGDWTAARTIAAQDLAPNLVDERVQQWMALAKPVRASDQVAALTGVTPAAADPGQPVRLALHATPTRQAQAQAPQAPPVRPQAALSVMVAAPRESPEPALVAEPAPVAIVLEEPAAAPEPAAFVELPTTPVAKPVPARPTIRSASFVPAAGKPPARKASAPRQGRSTAVVQLGAYGSRERVSHAWDVLSSRHPALRQYVPVSARFESARGLVYRLSIKGFDSQQEAVARCRLLRSRGGSCFVRSIAGDAPVQFASR